MYLPADISIIEIASSNAFVPGPSIVNTRASSRYFYLSLSSRVIDYSNSCVSCLA
jgi:hypothetical protein